MVTREVRGHSGHQYNEEEDLLARAGTRLRFTVTAPLVPSLNKTLNIF